MPEWQGRRTQAPRLLASKAASSSPHQLHGGSVGGQGQGQGGQASAHSLQGAHHRHGDGRLLGLGLAGLAHNSGAGNAGLHGVCGVCVTVETKCGSEERADGRA